MGSKRPRGTSTPSPHLAQIEVPTSSCVHHWMIEPPNGTPKVSGTCKRCSVIREFNVSAALEWGAIKP